MTVWDRATEQPGAGRWHVRLRDPVIGIVSFQDFQATSVEDATTQANTQFPSLLVEWAVREPQCYGVFYPSGPRE